MGPECMDDLGRDLDIGARIDDLKDPPIRPPELLASAGLNEENVTAQKRAAAKNALLAQRRIRFESVVLIPNN